jgi:hypothetical protein
MAKQYQRVIGGDGSYYVVGKDCPRNQIPGTITSIVQRRGKFYASNGVEEVIIFGVTSAVRS